MTVEETGEEDGEGLPQGHDDRKNCSAKLINGVEDKELAARRAHGQQNGVEGKLGVAGHKGKRVKEGALLQQRADGEETGEHVYPKHHLHRRHLVLEQVVLPVRGEAVEDDVAHEDDEPAEGGDGGRVFAGVAGQQEHADAHGDQHGGKILPVFVALVRDDFTHQHHRNDFGGLGKHLSGEADVFEGLVLAPAAEDVGEGSERVLVHGHSVARLVEHEAPQPRHGQSEDPVHEDQELGVRELLPRLFWSRSVGARHHSLLQDSPRQVGHLDMKKLGVKSLLKKTYLNIFK